MAPFVQNDLARALLARDRSVPAGVTAPNAACAERRFAVHRHNVFTSLAGALASRFPAAERIVGRNFFAAMARAYIEASPPRSPVLLSYGDDLAAFVEQFDPAADVPYLADVVRLEGAQGRAYHAADVAPLDPGSLRELSPDRLAGLTFELHPAASVVRSKYPVLTIWAMNTGEGTVTPIVDWSPQDALVTRPHLAVEVRSLPRGGGAFLSSLAAGLPLGAATAVALLQAPDFDLTANVTGMLHAGVLAALR